MQRAVTGLQHLGERAEDFPGRSVTSGKTIDEGTLVYSAYDPSNCRLRPPIIAATRWPTRNSPLGSLTMVPMHSMPKTRGSTTVGDSPMRVNHSERFRPKAPT